MRSDRWLAGLQEPREVAGVALDGVIGSVVALISRSAPPYQSLTLPEMRIHLSDDRRARLIRSIKQHFVDEFDDPISDFRAEGLIDFFVRELGPAVYNQGVRDAASFMQENLLDIEGDVYETERS